MGATTPPAVASISAVASVDDTTEALGIGATPPAQTIEPRRTPDPRDTPANAEFFDDLGSPGGAAKLGLIEKDVPLVVALPPQEHDE